MGPRRLGNTLGLAYLVCLHERPMYPYEAAKLLRQSRKEESLPLNYGSLYSAVASLATRGLIAPRCVTRQGRQPPRTVYAITEQGRKTTQEWLAEILRDPSNRSSRFQAALSLMAVLPASDATRLLRQRAKRLELDVAAVETQINQAKATSPAAVPAGRRISPASPCGRGRLDPRTGRQPRDAYTGTSSTDA
jgi:DNA-binding PadR family transcriptional regulator